MPKINESFSVNDRINHAVYGLGTILQLNERRTTIAFDDHRTRIFVTSMVELEHSTSTMPTRAKASRAPRRTKATK